MKTYVRNALDGILPNYFDGLSNEYQIIVLQIHNRRFKLDERIEAKLLELAEYGYLKYEDDEYKISNWFFEYWLSSEKFIGHAINSLQGNIQDLEVIVSRENPELIGDIERVKKVVEEIKNVSFAEDVSKSEAMGGLRQFLNEVNDTGTTIGKTIKGVKNAHSTLQDIAGYYNNIAEWCGLPVVPRLFLGK